MVVWWKVFGAKLNSIAFLRVAYVMATNIVAQQLCSKFNTIAQVEEE